MEFSKLSKDFLEKYYPDKDIYNMSLKELKLFRDELHHKRDEFTILEMAMKTLGNAAYGASANEYFYFWNVSLAGDITGECRNLTKTMWDKLEHFFHEELWTRKDIQEQFGFELDESKHEWYRQQPISVYSDTDSVYTTYGTLFQCMTNESKEKFKTDKEKLDFILKFNKEFVDKQNNQWCDEMYNPRHGHNIHEFELETVSRAQICLKKKKYLKGYKYVKGKFYDKPKVAGTGIELIKSTTPRLCKDILSDLMESLMFDFDNSTEESKEEFILQFNQKISDYRKQFYKAPLEDISQSIGVGDYKKYVVNDEESLVFEKQCPVSVHAAARFNYLAHKNGEDNLKFYSGKIKYYNIAIGEGKKKTTAYFGYPVGELPKWAPPMDKLVQWKKNVIDPINRFLEVMQIPLVNESGSIQLSLF